MARAVRWAGRARSDLRSAVEYIRKASPASAASFLHAVLDRTRSLAEASERGRVVPELDDPEVRQLLVGRYRVLYEVQADTVWVLRIIHGSRDRNNVGGWPIRRVEPAQRRRDFEYFAAKDRQMASEATVGLMLWDGQSRGTLLNVLRLVAQGKTAVVYVAPDKVFKDVRSDRDFDELFSGLDQGNAARLQQQAVSEGLGRHLDREAQLRL